MYTVNTFHTANKYEIGDRPSLQIVLYLYYSVLVLKKKKFCYSLQWLLSDEGFSPCRPHNDLFTVSPRSCGNIKSLEIVSLFNQMHNLFYSLKYHKHIRQFNFFLVSKSLKFMSRPDLNTSSHSKCTQPNSPVQMKDGSDTYKVDALYVEGTARKGGTLAQDDTEVAQGT